MSATTSPFRQILEKCAAEAESFLAQAREHAQAEVSAQLNQAARRIRQCASHDELANTLADASAGFARGAVVFRLTGDKAKATVPDLEIAMKSAPAFAGAVESRDPVIAAATAGEVSAEVVQQLGHAPGERASIFPMITGDSVPALLYCWGEAQRDALELLAQVAAAQWASLIPAAPKAAAPDVTAITPAPKRAPSWESLKPEEQRMHLSAQRFARVRIADIRLNEAEAVQMGRAHRNLYTALRASLDAAREAFREKYFAACPSMVDYVHVELVRTLANDHAELLGEEYPGPML